MSPTVEEIRKEVDEVVAAVSSVITKFKESGVNYGTLIAAMPGFMELLDTGRYFVTLTKQEKAEFFGEVFDALTGTDEYAVVTTVGPIPPAVAEQFLDASKGIVVALIAQRLEEKEAA